MGRLFELSHVQIAIGLAGGVFLLIMSIQMLATAAAHAEPPRKALDRRPLLAGVVLSATNPCFLIWWATVGLALASRAVRWGIWAFALFAVVHWSVDLGWLELLSWAAYKGTAVFGPRSRRRLRGVLSGRCGTEAARASCEKHPSAAGGIIRIAGI